MVQPLRCWAKSAPPPTFPGWNRVKLAENLVATSLVCQEKSDIVDQTEVGTGRHLQKSQQIGHPLWTLP